MKTSALLLALGLLSLPLSAQQVTLRGEVEDVPGAPGQFTLDFTEIQLIGSGISLNALAEQKVELTGQWDGDAATPTVWVTAASPSAEAFEIGDALRVGRGFSLEMRGAPGTTAIGVLSTGTRFQRLRSGEVILVDLAQSVLTVTRTIPNRGELELPFSLPNSPALAGLDIFGQAAFLSPGRVEMSNPYAATIRN